MLETVTYDRAAAVAYAHEWAFARNPRYADFEDMGGDCTNFISQCVFAGNRQMNFSPVLGWYYLDLSNRTPSWSGVEYFYKFMTGNRDGAGPFARRAGIAELLPGDVVQLRFASEHFGHSLLVVSADAPDETGIRIATHTFDSDSRQLSTYHYQETRYLHVEGVRRYV
ncbi:MAG: amidase domain-containing protein [Acetanaerobacterium sp.]